MDAQRYIEEDIANILKADFIDWNGFKGRSFLVSGGTGLIGKLLVETIVRNDAGSHVTVITRDAERAASAFPEAYLPSLSFVEWNGLEDSISGRHFDYIVHAASPTSSKYFVTNPVETIDEIVSSTFRLLRIAHASTARMVFLSTMEVYGTPSDDDAITEASASSLDTMSARSCYPEAKRLAENLCASFHAEYGVDIYVLRLTQTFGAGVGFDDGRVFAYFARCAINGEDIVLKTKGQTKRNYLYTADAVTAILKILQDGKPGEAYNAANEETYCTIAEMAGFVADEIAEGRISVRYDLGADTSMFAPEMHLNLSAAKLHALGWHPEIGIDESLRRMIGHMEMERKSHAEG